MGLSTRVAGFPSVPSANDKIKIRPAASEDPPYGIQTASCSLPLPLIFCFCRTKTATCAARAETITNELTMSVYKPLEKDHDAFRLIQIHPARDSEEKVQVDLVTARLSDNPVYEALSYVWGPPPNDRPVAVNGGEVRVRSSLDEFLRVVRHETEARLVYADAICINQDDDREKESQVQIMGSIFQNAQAVLSYLGPGDADTDALLRASAKVRAEDYIITKKVNSEAEGGHWKEGIFDEAKLEIFKPAMLHLVNYEYWKRAWIIQECLTAKEVYLYFGRTCTSWEEFLNMYMFLINKEPKARVYTWGYIKDEWTSITRFDHIAGQRARRDKFPCHLADIVTYFNSAQSVDPRDMVYAFLGLIKESHPSHPRRLLADYTISPTDLYFLAGHAYIFSPESGRPHRVLFGLKAMLHLTTDEVLHAVCELIDPDGLVSPIDWIVGNLTDEVKEDRKFRQKPRPENTPYMECFEKDFTTLTTLLREKNARGRNKDSHFGIATNS
jgi:hypothetical protein